MRMHKGLVVLVACSCMVAGSLWGMKVEGGTEYEADIAREDDLRTNAYEGNFARVKELLDEGNRDPEALILAVSGIERGYFAPVRRVATANDIKNAKNTIALLLAAKADVDAQNEMGQTALIVAAQNGRVDIVRQLLKAHARLDLRDNEGNTALDIAVREKYSDIIKELKLAAKKKGSVHRQSPRKK